MRIPPILLTPSEPSYFTLLINRFHELSGDKLAVRASCNPSYSTEVDDEKLVHVVFDVNSNVVFSHCTCTVG